MGMTSDDLYSLIQSNKGKTPSQPSVDTNSENLYNLINGPKAEKESTPWSDVLTRAFTNTPKSAVEFGKNIYQAVTNPLDTIEGVARLAVGAGHSLKPEHIASFIDHSDWDPEDLKKSIQTAKAVGDIYKERYGSSEGFKEAVATDPVGVASDLATILSGGSSLASKTGLIGKATELANKAGISEKSIQTAGKVAENLNPVTAASNVVSAVGKPLLGSLTGVGSENIANAAKAGYAGDTSFVNQMRGNAAINEPLDAARANLSTMRQNRGNAYRSGMTDITNDKSILNFDDINKALKDAKDSISFKGQTGAEVPTEVHEKLSKIVNDWQKLDPAEYHTPEGLDFLKQNIGDYTKTIGYEHTNANRIASDIYNSIKQTVSKQAPKYAEVMKDYHEASDQIQEIEKALSLGNKASADTAMRKLQSITRNNVNTNYGQRLNLAQQLEQEGGRPFINALSGQAMNSPTARGLAGTAENFSTLGGFLHPGLWAALPFQTPRIVGEGLYAGGRAAKAISKLSKKTGIGQGKANTIADILQNVNKEQEEQ
jgi:hypothetical protein